MASSQRAHRSPGRKGDPGASVARSDDLRGLPRPDTAGRRDVGWSAGQAFYVMGGSTAAGYRAAASIGSIGASCVAWPRQVHGKYNLGGTPPTAELPEDPAHGLYRFKPRFGSTVVHAASARWILSSTHERPAPTGRLAGLGIGPGGAPMTALLTRVLRHPALSPTVVREMWREQNGGHVALPAHGPHLLEAVAWLERAQDAGRDGGISRAYSPPGIRISGREAGSRLTLRPRGISSPRCTRRHATSRVPSWPHAPSAPPGGKSRSSFRPGRCRAGS